MADAVVVFICDIVQKRAAHDGREHRRAREGVDFVEEEDDALAVRHHLGEADRLAENSLQVLDLHVGQGIGEVAAQDLEEVEAVFTCDGLCQHAFGVARRSVEQYAFLRRDAVFAVDALFLLVRHDVFRLQADGLFQKRIARFSGADHPQTKTFFRDNIGTSAEVSLVESNVLLNIIIGFAKKW